MTALAGDCTAVIQKLRAAVETMLEDGRVKYVIGFGKGTDSFHSTPVFIFKPEDAEKLIWSPTCTNNLSVYLLDEWRKMQAVVEAAEDAKRKGKTVPPMDRRPVAIVVKGCDSRTLVELIKEKIIPREEVHVLGIPCDGVIDQAKAERAWHDAGLPNRTAFDIVFEMKDRTIIALLGGNEVSDFKSTDILAEKCRECIYHTPLIYDELLDEAIPPTMNEEFADAKKMETLPLSDKWAFWKEYFTRCIRCNACRSICSLCYCTECIVDPSELALKPDTTAVEKATRPQWMERSPTFNNNMIFHSARTVHMFGRCPSCGECTRACPVGIPLQKLMKKVQKEVKEQFGYEVGTELDAKPFATLANPEDKETFIM